MHSQSFTITTLTSEQARSRQNYNPEDSWTSQKRTHNRAFGYVPDGRHLRRSMLLAYVSVFVLPTELLVIIAKFASDEDLYSLTCVSRRMADVTCSILIARQGLTVDRVSVCVEGNAFNALPVWYRSVEFVPKSLLFCTFSDDHKQAASQITRLRTFLSLRPTRARFETVHLIGLDIKLPIDLLSLLDLIDLVGCQKVVMSARCVSWQQDIICSLGSTSASRLKDDDQSQLAGSPVCLSALKHLEIDYRFFSAALWAVFLERLHITSLSSLRICGESSISTLKQFLVRHPHISCIEVQPRSSIFHRRTPPSRALRGNLKLAKLQRLHGSVPHVLSLLRSLSYPPPSLCQLKLTSENVPYHIFMHKAKQCLTLCKGPLRLFIDHWFYGHDLSIPKLTSQSVTARKLRCNAELAQVTEIDITFNPSSNGSVLAYCAPWFELYPRLMQIDVRVYAATNPSAMPKLRIGQARRNGVGHVELSFK